MKSKSALETVRELLVIGRDHGRYDQIRIACALVHGEQVTAEAERSLA